MAAAAPAAVTRAESSLDADPTATRVPSLAGPTEKAAPLGGSDDPYLHDYPDGGARAWWIVLGGACTTFSTFGYVNAWGVFQEYYQATLLRDSSPSNIAWIGSIQYSLVFVPCLLVGHVFDRGYFRAPFLCASVFLVIATFLVGECTQYWQFLLCQGFAVGISAGIIWGPLTAIIGHWFKRRRGLATGFLAAGSSLGGTLFPIISRNLIPRIGFQWALRVIGCILVCTLGIANLTLRRRLPPKHVSGGLLNLAAFKSAAYTVYCLSGIVAFLGVYTVSTYIGVSATSAGVSPDFAFYLLSIVNGASLVGRLVAAIMTDRLGAVNVISPMTALAALMTYVWPLARSKAGFVGVALVYGFASGAYVSSFILPLYHMGDIADVGRRSGMTVTLTAVGALVGPPISGAINTATGGYQAVGYYAGSTIILAIVLMLVARHLVLGRLRGKF
ncbi:unnamed protein product [Mycena citricolor]|uniref:Major facilitator superfamily (MFS) profile domain-containing protein n=1 Tax=Mycena citricolor TaxID=2018698 RepID=A0AAD2K6F3_9AGAR|nr:unnamed protein product [Mycena citricolor]